jgi:hypothetical protein
VIVAVKSGQDRAKFEYTIDAKLVGKGNPAACDLQQSSCTQTTAEGVTIEFDMQPKPVTALSDLKVIVRLSQSGAPLTDATVSLDLSMPGMFMGTNRPVMQHVQAGRYEGKAVITRCPSGRKTWNAHIAVAGQNRAGAADFVFEVK